jgi:uncharacterized protein
MTVVDVHGHLGYDNTFDEDFTEAELMEAHEHGVGVTIVQPGTCVYLEDVQRQHDAIADLCARRPGQFFGMANPCPHLREDDYRREMERCVRVLKFVGVKLHPLAHAVKPGGTAGERVMRTARDLGIPVMVHTGAGAPFALPSAMIPVAQKYPDVKIVLAHAGASIYSGEASLALSLCPNVYLDTSWSAGFALRGWVREFGANRLMMASDHGDNAATELTKHRTCGLTQEELEWCLGRTAVEVYKLPIG